MDAAATTASSATPFAELITSLAVMQHDQHQALLDLRHDQERRFQAVLQAQQEDRERFRSWIDREVRPEATVHQAVPAHLPLNKMGPEDDPEAFLDLFEKAAEVHGWPRDQWPMRLVPLLSGESQVAAQQLPVRNLLVFEDLKRAIIQRVGRSPEQHRQRFRSLELGESGRPFVLAQQLRDSCRKWLLADGSDVEEIIDRVVLEQFVTRLPRKTAEWVQCHHPTSLESAIHLAEDHMVACPGVGEPLPSASLSPSFSSPSLSRPVPLPRSRPPGPPRVPPRGRGRNGQNHYAAPRVPPRGAGLAPAGLDPAPVSPLSPRQPLNPVAGKSGPACWRCGDPDHFVDRCPVMEVGTMIRVPDVPQAAPGQAGWYQIPVSIKGGTYQALVDSGCNQTSIHQSLIQSGALDTSRMVKVRCVHGDVVEYPILPVIIKFRGQKHSVEVAVNPHLRHPLILGTNWPAFKELLGILCTDASWGENASEGSESVQVGETEPGPLSTASGEKHLLHFLSGCSGHRLPFSG
ncbi:hypothetical protein ABG768_009613 [Culter alburnus]|uniref:SCAN domain-containing protein SCAND2P n=1 Tax=Culter alburnus TaxID=194366 RepID=A0AAW1ZGH6_CULAL